MLADTATAPSWLAGNTQNIWYWTAFIFSGGVIFAFTLKRFNELLFPISTDLLLLLSNNTASSITSRNQFRTGFAAYVFVYLVGYAALCLCQPLAAWAFGVSDKALPDAWATPAGPLVVLALLIGVLPNFPIVDQLDERLRRLGHRIAGIPDDLLQLINDVGRSTYIDDMTAVIDDGGRDSLAAAKLITEILGITDATRRSIQNDLLHATLLGEWTYGEQAREVWSARVLARFESSQKIGRAEAEQCNQDLRILIRDWNRLAVKAFDQELQNCGLSFDKLLDQDVEANTQETKESIGRFREANSAIVDDMLVRWNAFAGLASRLSYHMESLIALFLMNDLSPNVTNTPSYMRNTIAEIRIRRLGETLNPILLASFAGIVASAVAVVVWRIGLSIGRGDGVPLLDLIRIALRLGWIGAETLLLLFSIPIIVASLIRHWRKNDKKWESLSAGAGISFIQVLGVAFWSFAAAAILQVVNYLFYQILIYIDNSRAGSNFAFSLSIIFASFFSGPFFLQLLISLLGAGFSICVCYLLDRFETKEVSIRSALVIICSLTLLTIAIFSAIQIPFAPDGYFAPKTINQIVVLEYDNLIEDYSKVGFFVLFFIIVICHQLTRARPT